MVGNEVFQGGCCSLEHRAAEFAHVQRDKAGLLRVQSGVLVQSAVGGDEQVAGARVVVVAGAAVGVDPNCIQVHGRPRQSSQAPNLLGVAAVDVGGPGSDGLVDEYGQLQS